MNRLRFEKSPYLLQHADNPVDWYPWCDEAFRKAKEEDKPVFLSIGYSTCHWCHVMEKESFEDEEVADILNRDFVCIKVDREERPDIDSIYMTACQLFNGSGGWPLTIIMTPQQKPFWTGTYLPKRSGYGRMGLIELLTIIRHLWDSEREKLIEKGEEVTRLLMKEEQKSKNAPAVSFESLIAKAVEKFKAVYDERYGGFGGAPKFPAAHNLIFLLSLYSQNGDDELLSMVKHTLDCMYKGGLFDHVGGGFSRYSTDERWLVPHFEKMLYDNALLVIAYLDAYLITGEAHYKSVAEKTLNYILNELTDSGGGFYCGQDADSDGKEGAYYIFSKDEIDMVLGENSEYFCNWFSVTKRGNFERKNILNLTENKNYATTNVNIERLLKKLYDYRKTRTRLHKDDKVLTSWNALAIVAFSKAGRILSKTKYLNAAIRCAEFIESNLTDENGDLFIRWRDGDAAHMGQLDDYAFYAWALLELYNSTFDTGYLKKAVLICEKIIDYFLDKERGGLYLYSIKSEKLLIRPKETYDAAMPSGNSVAALVFDKLFKLTGDIKWKDRTKEQLDFLASSAKSYPAGHSVALTEMICADSPSYELIAVTDKEFPSEAEKLFKSYYFNLTTIVKNKQNAQELDKLCPFTSGYEITPGKTKYYLCKGGSCMAPTESIEEIITHINE